MFNMSFRGIQNTLHQGKNRTHEQIIEEVKCLKNLKND